MITDNFLTARKQDERSRVSTLLNRIRRLGYEMPTSIAASEKPDFILEYGSRTIGLEMTLAVEGEYARALKLYPQESIIITQLKDRKPRRSNQEIAEEILSPDTPWKSLEDQMTDWQKKIEKSLLSKRAKLNQVGFKLLDENWLLIYDLPFLANDEVARSLSGRLLTELFSKPWEAAKDFDTVFVYSDRYLYRWSENKLDLHYSRS